MSELRVSAKQLGELALPDFCPRCFWLKMRLRHKMPYQFFPGIFSSIDAYTKNVMHEYFDRGGPLPSWMEAEFGQLTGYKQPPTWRTFQAVDVRGILVTGSPDGVFVQADGRHVIVDYKTSRFTATQDSLFPMYQVQLNVYAWLGERCGLSPVSRLALIYTEPQTEYVIPPGEMQFVLPFTPKVKHVDVNTNLLDPLLERVKQLGDLLRPPSGTRGCQDCKRVNQLVEVMRW